MATKRVPKTKEELRAQVAHIQKVEHQKKLARSIYTLIKNQKTVYDAQTVLNASAGYIENEFAKKSSEIKVSELLVDVSKDKGDKVLVNAVQNIISFLGEESADFSVALLNRFANSLGDISAKKYMENPMKKITVQDIVA